MHCVLCSTCVKILQCSVQDMKIQNVAEILSVVINFLESVYKFAPPSSKSLIDVYKNNAVLLFFKQELKYNFINSYKCIMYVLMYV